MKNSQKKENLNPCRNCFLGFMSIYEDCTFCARFADACEYNGTTVEEQVWGFKTSSKAD